MRQLFILVPFYRYDVSVFCFVLFNAISDEDQDLTVCASAFVVCDNVKLALIGSRGLKINNMGEYIPCGVDEIVSGGAKGTQYTIKILKKLKKRVTVVLVDTV